MMTKQNPTSDLAIAPGEYLVEVLENLHMTQADLARRMGRPIQAINEIIKGSKAITPDTALQLEKVTDVPAHLWMNLEEEYRLTLARQMGLGQNV
jgi:HTH-type transcriptional regulator / antitoxin HigA